MRLADRPESEESTKGERAHSQGLYLPRQKTSRMTRARLGGRKMSQSPRSVATLFRLQRTHNFFYRRLEKIDLPKLIIVLSMAKRPSNKVIQEKIKNMNHDET